VANSGKKANGFILSILVIISIMVIKFLVSNTLIHYLKFW